MKNITAIILWSFLIFLIFSCRSNINNNEQKIYVMHAGSLSLPLKIIKDSFEQRYSDVNVFLQACGSKQCVRNIIDLHKQWDIFFSADMMLIDSFLYPQLTTKKFSFVSNEMVVAYTQKSKYSDSINLNNWTRILAQPDVVLAFSDPLSDPCGVRVISVLTLTEKYFSKDGLLSAIRFKPQNVYIRPKEIDIISLLELGTVDYTIIYKSLATQFNLKFIELPDSINLSNTQLQPWYSMHTIRYKLPNQQIKTEPIHAIEYGYCINHKSESSSAVKLFLDFLKTKTVKQIMQQTGHTILY
ncbi:MAG: substrate-binding domain-containing protein [Bacteroidales bacterium]|nr:substrate-binding domain-containing protein [Bacteroidales bacterium]